MNLQQIRRVALCAAMAALCIAGAGWLSSQPVAGREAKPATLNGAAALERLKQDGQYKSLQAAMNQARFNIEMEGSEAASPLPIDPLFNFQEKLMAADGAAGDFFVAAVAMRGDTLVIGSAWDDVTYADQGSAYVFARNGATWTQQQKLVASDGVLDDFFGRAVALSGNTLVVGANSDSASALLVDCGSAYVFTRNGGVWTQQQKIIAPDAGWEDYFGYEIAFDGDTLVVGAPGDDIGANNSQGSAYVYKRNGAFWTLQQKLIADDGGQYKSFGKAFALDGDTLVVGALDDKIGANAAQGSAYVFMRDGAIWTQQAKLTANDGTEYDRFGSAVALDGATLVVGAFGADVTPFSRHGAAYVFLRSPCPAFTFSPASLPDGDTNIWYQQSVNVSGGAGPYQFAVTGGAPPPGMSLISNGLLSGTPQTPGAYQFTVRATDLSSLCSASRVYTLGIQPPCDPLTIDPPTLPSGMRGAPYNETLTVTDGVYPFTFSKKGVLPPGLSLGLDGVISGVATQTGNFSFTAMARDARGCVGSRTYSILITRPGIEISAARPGR